MTTIQRKFVLKAIEFQLDMYVLYDTSENDKDFLEYYGFTKKQLEKELIKLRKTLKGSEISESQKLLKGSKSITVTELINRTKNV